MLAAQIQNLPPIHVPPPPSPPIITRVIAGGPGGAPVDEEEIVDATTELEDENLVEVAATSLDVIVSATILDVLVTERGNLLYFEADFKGDPGSVFFSFMRPGEQRPRVDPGFSQKGSAIRRLSEGIYAMIIDTTGFAGGILQWHFWSEGLLQKSEFGQVMVRDRPKQLL